MPPKPLSVDTLLDMYEQYKQLTAQRPPLERSVACAKLSNSPDTNAEVALATLNNRIAALSDAMTFALPSIWIGYKFRAYQHEAQPIRTLGDFRLHCSKPGYICTKRFMFLNSYMRAHGIPPLDNDSYVNDMYLDDALLTRNIQQAETLPGFAPLWQTYEYNTQDGNIAKWENYTDT